MPELLDFATLRGANYLVQGKLNIRVSIFSKLLETGLAHHCGCFMMSL